MQFFGASQGRESFLHDVFLFSPDGAEGGGRKPVFPREGLYRSVPKCPLSSYDTLERNSSAVAKEHPQLRGLQPSVQIGKDGLWNVIILELIAWKDMSPGSLICIFTSKSKMTCRCLNRANHRLCERGSLDWQQGTRLLWTWVAGAKWAELFEEKTPVD